MKNKTVQPHYKKERMVPDAGEKRSSSVVYGVSWGLNNIPVFIRYNEMVHTKLNDVGMHELQLFSFHYHRCLQNKH